MLANHRHSTCTSYAAATTLFMITLNDNVSRTIPKTISPRKPNEVNQEESISECYLSANGDDSIVFILLHLSTSLLKVYISYISYIISVWQEVKHRYSSWRPKLHVVVSLGWHTQQLCFSKVWFQFYFDLFTCCQLHRKCEVL